MPEINVEELLTNINKEMQEAEDALDATGFPFEQWELIRRYILAAVHYNTVLQLKAAMDSNVSVPNAEPITRSNP